MIDVAEIDAALQRAAWTAVHGTREERAGRFLRRVRMQTFAEKLAALIQDHLTFPGNPDAAMNEVLVALRTEVARCEDEWMADPPAAVEIKAEVSPGYHVTWDKDGNRIATPLDEWNKQQAGAPSPVDRKR